MVLFGNCCSGCGVRGISDAEMVMIRSSSMVIRLMVIGKLKRMVLVLSFVAVVEGWDGQGLYCKVTGCGSKVFW